MFNPAELVIAKSKYFHYTCLKGKEATACRGGKELTPPGWGWFEYPAFWGEHLYYSDVA